jgi:hypothetical protein
MLGVCERHGTLRRTLENDRIGSFLRRQPAWKRGRCGYCRNEQESLEGIVHGLPNLPYLGIASTAPADTEACGHGSVQATGWKIALSGQRFCKGCAENRINHCLTP